MSEESILVYNKAIKKWGEFQNMKKILFLEDDIELGETVVEMLEEKGYSVSWAKDGEEAAEISFENVYDLYIFDVNVPYMDGFELLEALREAKDATPTIFISARVDLESIAHGFSAGGFDYLKKPFFPQELMIRIEAKIGSKRAYRCRDIEYNPSSKEVRKSGELLQFGDVGFALFHLFMSRQNSVIDKSELIDCLEHPSDTALRVALNKLKQTTGLEIKNIRGVGYILESC